MGDVHPHWHITEADAPTTASVDALSNISKRGDIIIPADAVIVSRRPAAIVGILMVLAIGYTLVQGVGGLLGQLTGTDNNTITITSTGFTPSKLTVHPGDTVVWKNQDEIPHIVFSDTLKLANDTPLQTSPIFKGADQSVIIPATTAPGDYPYASRTKSAFSGTIIVVAVVVSASSVSSIAAVESSSSVSSDAVSSGISSIPAVIPTQSSSDAIPVLPSSVAGMTSSVSSASMDGGIPQNPFTVGTNVPPATGGKGQTASFIPVAPTITQHVPTKQPSSGPADLWIIISVSGGLLLLMTRKAFVA